ncbi:MAG: biotin transporter BioY [Gammaproteobacteria bacterium]|nr:biotin transporter BioY [Gammaproteobacteria bacterium]
MMTIWPVELEKGLFRNITLVFVGSLLLAISSNISIPFYPVPMTMQTLVVLGLGMAYGWKLGGLTVGLYLLEGLAGFPVFSGTPEKGVGLAYMMGGTGGYLLGFVFACVATGFLAERGWDRNAGTTALAMLVGNVIIYIPGLLWLAALYGWDKPIIEWGLTPFVFGDIAKILIASAIMPLCWRVIGKKKSAIPEY